MGSFEEQNSSVEVLPPTEFKINPDTINLVKNDGTKEAYQVIGKVEATFERFAELANTTKCDVNDLITIWSSIPVENSAGSDSLEKSGEVIIAVSDAVDKKCPNMPAHKRTALKFRIIAELLNSKAELLESDN